MDAGELRARLIVDSSGMKRGLAEGEAALVKTEHAVASTERKVTGFSRSTGFLSNALGQFGIPFTGALDKMGAKMDAAATKGSTFKTIMGAASVAAVVALGAIAVESIHMADAFEESHARLETAVHNVGASMDEYGGKIKDTDNKLVQFGFSSTETESALARLVTGTKDVGKATDLMSLAADIARARNVDLTTATDMLVKVEAGKFALLGRTLGLSKETIASLHSEADAINLLKERYGGAAAANAETFAGKMRVLKVEAGEVGIKIGQALIPQVEHMASAALHTINAIQSVNDAMGGWLGKLTLVGGVSVFAVYAVMKIVDAVRALQAALAAGGKLSWLTTIATTLGPEVFIAAAAVLALGVAFSILNAGGDHIVSTIKKVSAGLLDVTTAADAAQGQLSKLISDRAADDLRKYADQLTANASAQDIATTKAQLSTDALRAAADSYFGHAQAVQMSDDELRQLATTNEGFGSSLMNTNSKVKAATDELEKLDKKYGEAAGQNARLQAAQKAYGDLLASGSKDSTALAIAHDNVVAASQKHAETQDKVNAATDEGTDKAKKAATANGQVKLTVDELVTGLQRAKIGFDNQADAETNTKDKADALARQLKALNEQTLASVDSSLAYENAVTDVGDKIDSYNTALQESGGRLDNATEKSRAAHRAQNDLRSSIVNVAAAAEKQTADDIALARSKGQVISAAEEENQKHGQAYAALENLKRQYPALSGMIQEYETRLGLIPNKVVTHVNADTSDADYKIWKLTGQLDALQRRKLSISIGVYYEQHGYPPPGSGSQHGSIATHATYALYGEAGPEAIVPLGRGAQATADRYRILMEASRYAPDLGGFSKSGQTAPYDVRGVHAPSVDRGNMPQYEAVYARYISAGTNLANAQKKLDAAHTAAQAADRAMSETLRHDQYRLDLWRRQHKPQSALDEAQRVMDVHQKQQDALRDKWTKILNVDQRAVDAAQRIFDAAQRKFDEFQVRGPRVPPGDQRHVWGDSRLLVGTGGITARGEAGTVTTHNSITIHMPPGSDGQDVVNALTKWSRHNGPVPINTKAPR